MRWRLHRNPAASASPSFNLLVVVSSFAIADDLSRSFRVAVSKLLRAFSHEGSTRSACAESAAEALYMPRRPRAAARVAKHRAVALRAGELGRRELTARERAREPPRRASQHFEHKNNLLDDFSYPCAHDHRHR